MTDPLMAFLTAQLDKRERVARATEEDSNPSHWEAGDGADGNDDEVYALAGGPLGNPNRCTEHGASSPNMCDDNPIIGVDSDFTSRVVEIAQHIALHDPAAVLADIAAKRAILAIHQADGPDPRWPRVPPWCPPCSDADDGTQPWPCPTVRALATAFRHEPGYRAEWAYEEWKP